MRAFKVSLNGKKLCLAGIGDHGVLTAIVSSVTKESIADLFLEVGGVVSPVHEQVEWERQKPLRLGDRVEVRIVEVKSVDTPRQRKRAHPAEALKARKRYVREMAKQLGWKIQTKSKPKTND